MNSISCFIDFSETGKTATSFAVWLSKKFDATVHLVHHVANTEDKQVIENNLVAHSEIEKAGVPFTCTIITGEVLKRMPEFLKEIKSDLLVIGSHISDSDSQIWSASNIVHLVQSIAISALVVNEHASLSDSPMQHILFPIAPHDSFNIQIEQSAKWAKQHDADIHVLCLDTTEGPLPERIERNLNRTEAYFETEHVKHTKTLKDSNVYSVGYAKDIISFAQEHQFDLITIMSQNSDENMYFGDMEKTNLIQNQLGIPVLFTN